MNRTTCRTFQAIVLAFGVAIVPLAGQAPAPDNSKVNARDKKPAQVTAEQQSNTRPDVDITRDIRKAIVADKSLSTYAHNVKVVTKKGKVTLKGPVRSDAEKQTIETLAAQVAGAANVTNQLAVAPADGAKTPKKVGH